MISDYEIFDLLRENGFLNVAGGIYNHYTYNAAKAIYIKALEDVLTTVAVFGATLDTRTEQEAIWAINSATEMIEAMKGRKWQ